MTSFVIYAVYVASNVCFLRAVAARSVVHVRAFILGAPVWYACAVHGAPGVRGDPFVRPSPYAIHSLCMPFLYSYDLLYTLYLPLRQPYAFILGATRGSVRAPSMHLPRYTHTHAHPIITIRPALYTSDTLPVAPSCYINIYRQRLPGGRNLRAARGAARPHRLGAGVTSV